ncbi:hypothetical protein SDC9_79851 [bioreactor metagenome]|uniref:Uncharacterized protein n=1 Tax=bioreactor metagenome TaxID=1076179 RepID=A0A644YZM3_9ZZZZ
MVLAVALGAENNDNLVLELEEQYSIVLFHYLFNNLKHGHRLQRVVHHMVGFDDGYHEFILAQIESILGCLGQQGGIGGWVYCSQQ